MERRGGRAGGKEWFGTCRVGPKIWVGDGIGAGAKRTSIGNPKKKRAMKEERTSGRAWSKGECFSEKPLEKIKNSRTVAIARKLSATAGQG